MVLWTTRTICIMMALLFATEQARSSTEMENTPYWIIRDIEITGNKRTKIKNILREMDIAKGDTLWQHLFQSDMERNENLLLNTGLFYFVEIRLNPLSEIPQAANILVNLEEYGIIGYGFNIQMADRNFNIWLQEKDHLLDRLDFSINFSLNNFDGNNQRVSLKTQLGYTEKLRYIHQISYLNRQRTIGLKMDGMISRNKEINFQTLGGKQAFHIEPGRHLLFRNHFNIQLSFRGRHVWRHYLDVGLFHHRVDKFVVDSLNALFFKEGYRQTYDMAAYSLVYEGRDRIIYPLKGKYCHLSAEKRGFFYRDQVHLFRVIVEYQDYQPLGKEWYYKVIAKGGFSLIRNFPGYFQHRLLGDRQNTIRGYELFVFEGLDFGYLKQSFRKRIYQRDLGWLSWIPSSRFEKVNLKIYGSFNADIGYVNDPFEQTAGALSNKILVGSGFGIDFVLMQDMVFIFECTTNAKGLTGLYLHTRFGL